MNKILELTELEVKELKSLLEFMLPKMGGKFVGTISIESEPEEREAMKQVLKKVREL